MTHVKLFLTGVFILAFIFSPSFGLLAKEVVENNENFEEIEDIGQTASSTAPTDGKESDDLATTTLEIENNIDTGLNLLDIGSSTEEEKKGEEVEFFLAQETATTTEHIEVAATTSSDIVSVEVNVREGDSVIFGGEIELDKNATTTLTDSSGTNHVIETSTVLSAIVKTDNLSEDFEISELQYFEGIGFYIKCLEIHTVDFCDHWQYVANDTYPFMGVDNYEVFDGDVIYFYFGTPRRFALSATSTHATIPVTITVESYDYTDNTWSPLPDAKVGATQPNPDDAWTPLVPYSETTNTEGEAVLNIDRAGTYGIGLAEDFYFPTKELIVLEKGEDDVVFRLRAGEEMAFEGVIPYPDAGTTTAVDSSGTSRELDKQSALYTLLEADKHSDSFEVSTLEYFEGFGSFYVKCISIEETEYCDNWQYAINEETPSIGMDSYTLSQGDEIFSYFATPRKVTLNKTEVETNEEFTATAEVYDFRTNIYKPVSGVTLGVTKENPENPFSPIVIATSTSNQIGQAVFTLAEVGSYGVGIAEDFYFPLTNLTVVSPGSDNNTPGGNSGNSTDEEDEALEKLDVAKAMKFLSGEQSGNGSFGSDLYTDWAVLAIAVAPNDMGMRSEIRNYLLSHDPSLQSMTDHERHAIALMALGIDPYSGTDTNYIQEIIDGFDGEQIGEDGLVNDDIFALFPLLKAGHDKDDEIIKKTVAFIVSRQGGNGAWESPDLTAATIQALSEVSSLPGVSSTIGRARDYLKNIQNDNCSFGSFGNGFTTSWVIQAIVALGENVESWAKDGCTPHSYLASLQQDDGGIGETALGSDARVWATSYAVTAAMEKTWASLMEEFSQQEVESENNAGDVSTETEDSETATSTPENVPEVLGVSTTTPETNDEPSAQGKELIYTLAHNDPPQESTTRSPLEVTDNEEEGVATGTPTATENHALSGNPVEQTADANGTTPVKIIIIVLTILALGGSYYFVPKIKA